MYFSKRNKRRPPREAYRLADILGLSVHQECKLTRDQMRKTVADSVMALREAQYKASELRQEWIERNSQDIAKAAGEPDWRRHMEKILRDERERETNRKLTAITKGIHQSLDWIEIPTVCSVQPVTISHPNTSNQILQAPSPESPSQGYSRSSS